MQKPRVENSGATSQALDRVDRWLPAGMAAVAAIVYLTTMAPTFSHTDSGELAAVQYTLGVAHPTGYPLFTLLGWLFTRIPFADPAWQLNLLCLLFTTGGVYFFTRALRDLFGSMKTRIAGEPEGKLSRVTLGNRLATIFGGATMAFSHTIWLQSTSVEVYSLHIFLLGLLIFLILKAWMAPKDALRPWLYVAVALALGFANHLTTLWILPGLAVLYFVKGDFSNANFIRLGKMLAIFFPLLLLLYAYLPVRAGMDPTYNWGNPEGYLEIKHHITGKQFSVWWFTGMEAFKENIAEFFTLWPKEFAYAILVLGIPGIWYGFKIRKYVTLFFLLGFVGSVAWAANYDIKDLETYYLLAFIATAFWVAMGMRFLWVRLKMTRQVRWALTGVAALALLFQIGYNYPQVNQRGAYQYEDYSRACLNSLPQNAMVISQSWDVFVSPAFYLQGVEAVRTDVDIVEFQFLRNRHWYPHTMRTTMPEIAALMPNELNYWEKAVQLFDLLGDPDPQRLATGFSTMMARLFRMSLQRPVLVGPEMPRVLAESQIVFPPGMQLRPEGYFYRLVRAAEYQQYTPITLPTEDQIRFKDDGEYETKLLRDQFTEAWARRAVYELEFNNVAAAKTIVQKIREVNPGVKLMGPLQNL